MVPNPVVPNPLYLTGLGSSSLQPTVTVGGKPGLDQINCQIAPGTTAGPKAAVIVTSAGRTSSTAALAIQ